MCSVKVRASLVAQMVKNSPAGRETWVRSLDWDDPLEEDRAIYSSTLAWESPWTEEPGGLQSMRLQRVRHDWVTKHCEGESCSIVSDSLRPHDYTVHGILQARIQDWVAIPFSRVSSQHRDWTQVSCVASIMWVFIRSLNHWDVLQLFKYRHEMVCLCSWIQETEVLD